MSSILFLGSYVILWCATIALGIAVFVLYRVNGQLLLSHRVPSELQVGGQLPAIAVSDRRGEAVVLGRPTQDRQVVSFVSPQCETCKAAVEGLRAWAESTNPEKVEVVVVVAGGTGFTEKSGAEVQRRGRRLVADPQWDVALQWGCRRVPWTMVCDRQGRLVASGAPVLARAFASMIDG